MFHTSGLCRVECPRLIVRVSVLIVNTDVSVKKLEISQLVRRLCRPWQMKSIAICGPIDGPLRHIHPDLAIAHVPAEKLSY